MTSIQNRKLRFLFEKRGFDLQSIMKALVKTPTYTRSQIIAPIAIPFPPHSKGGVVTLIRLSDISTNRFCVPSQFGNRELSI